MDNDLQMDDYLELDEDIAAYYMADTDLENNDTTTHPTSGISATGQIGTWFRTGVIGSGANGLVFLQKHRTTTVLRAVKTLRCASDREAWREIRSMLFVKRVNNYHRMDPDRERKSLTVDVCVQYRRLFVEIYAWYEVDEKYIAMEYLHGGNLMDYVRKKGVFAQSEAKGVAEQILQALFILHGDPQNPHSHRDLKPEVKPPICPDPSAL